jgi:macrodomain Ter protein organizer (MatP/YcbG family)
MDTLLGSRRIFPLERQNVGKKSIPIKIIVFLHPSADALRTSAALREGSVP